MKRVLIAVAAYPDNKGNVKLMYVHVRNKYYSKHDINVTVLNFEAEEDYIIDGIKVITLRTYCRENMLYDVLVCHAANLRNHYRFLKKNEKKFKDIVLFFHGHEVLKINREYPEPYTFLSSGSIVKKKLQNLYDSFKLKVWHSYYKKIAYKSHFVFVSHWIKNKFFEYTKIKESDLADVRIINNSVGAIFEQEKYDLKIEKKYDFITIRSDLDGSKYGVDLVVKLASENPELKFLIIGNGHYFEHNKKPENIELINHTLKHNEMLDYINKSKCALLLTREDTQGVMTCEMLAYGIPVITSDIDVCKEFFQDKSNCVLINNSADCDLKVLLNSFDEQYFGIKNEDFNASNTIQKEVELILGL